MSTLIAMACHDTVENKRSDYTERTLRCLLQTVPDEYRIVVIDNGSCEYTKSLLQRAKDRITIITLPENIGTARAINLAMQLRLPEEKFVKIDNDCVIHSYTWVQEMEACIERDPSIGIVGLKRKDLAESPRSTHPFYISTLDMLPHNTGERWIVVEEVHHVMGTCQMLSPALIDKVGFYYQKSLYGLDDSDMSYRSELLGFRNCFLPHIEIDHIDIGGDDYSNWKHQESGAVMGDYGLMCQEYRDGVRPLYYDGGFVG
jgi:GT2 family glycosyltransferase